MSGGHPRTLAMYASDHVVDLLNQRPRRYWESAHSRYGQLPISVVELHLSANPVNWTEAKSYRFISSRIQ